MKINFDSYGEMELETKIRSIFDRNIAGQIANDGSYYCIHLDHKTHKRYALSIYAHEEANSLGYTLEKEEEAIFNGEKVRAMTYDEEVLWNEDRLTANVDLWGNVAVDEEFDFEWYMENCI